MRFPQYILHSGSKSFSRHLTALGGVHRGSFSYTSSRYCDIFVSCSDFRVKSSFLPLGRFIHRSFCEKDSLIRIYCEKEVIVAPEHCFVGLEL